MAWLDSAWHGKARIFENKNEMYKMNAPDCTSEQKHQPSPSRLYPFGSLTCKAGGWDFIPESIYGI